MIAARLLSVLDGFGQRFPVLDCWHGSGDGGTCGGHAGQLCDRLTLKIVSGVWSARCMCIEEHVVRGSYYVSG